MKEILQIASFHDSQVYDMVELPYGKTPRRGVFNAQVEFWIHHSLEGEGIDEVRLKLVRRESLAVLPEP